MIKQVQKLPRFLEPGVQEGVSAWRSRSGQGCVGRGCATQLGQARSGRLCSPPSAPGFPAGSLRPAPSPQPPAPIGCVRGRWRGVGQGVLPACLASLPLPPGPRIQACVAMFPGPGRLRAPSFRGGSSGRLRRCFPQAGKLATRQEVPSAPSSMVL